jgi:hypothetical protein
MSEHNRGAVRGFPNDSKIIIFASVTTR